MAADPVSVREPIPPTLEETKSLLADAEFYARGFDQHGTAHAAGTASLLRLLAAEVRKKERTIGALTRRLEAEIERCDAAEARLRSRPAGEP